MTKAQGRESGVGRSWRFNTFATAAAASLVFAACAAGDGSALDLPAAPPRPAAPQPPDDCIEVTPVADAAAAGARLLAALREAPASGAVCLAPGVYQGNFEIDRGVTLWGPRTAVLENSGRGTTLKARGEHVRLLGFSLRGSGRRLDQNDAAVHLEGRGHVAAGLAIDDAIFGIVAEKARQVGVRDNVITGVDEAAFGLRGDAIRLWETYDSEVTGNVTRHGRDIVVWYSSRNVIAGNYVTLGRYGTHLMYSHGNTIRGNTYLRNVVGIFLMYSRHVTVDGNLIAGSAGAAGLGLGVKESGALRVTANRFVHNTTGIYLDTTPLQLEDHNVFERNLIALGGTGVAFHSSLKRNRFTQNRLENNLTTVRVEGGGDARDVEWEENCFDEYAGYDLDGDGVGDVPFELRSVSESLAGHYPDVEFFRGSPVMGLIEAASAALPLFTPATLLVDPRPRINLALHEAGDAH